jgi:hypothetical protein
MGGLLWLNEQFDKETFDKEFTGDVIRFAFLWMDYNNWYNSKEEINNSKHEGERDKATALAANDEKGVPQRIYHYAARAFSSISKKIIASIPPRIYPCNIKTSGGLLIKQI